MKIKLESAYAAQQNGNWNPLKLAIKITEAPFEIEVLPTDCALQAWIEWDQVEAIMDNVRTQPERAGNWHHLTEGGSLPDIGIHAQDQWGRWYGLGVSRVYLERGVHIAMRPEY